MTVCGQYSRSGLEFFKLFPDAHDTFEIGTAARMSATFPVVSPAVSLPTIRPPRGGCRLLRQLWR